MHARSLYSFVHYPYLYLSASLPPSLPPSHQAVQSHGRPELGASAKRRRNGRLSMGRAPAARLNRPPR
jgi:hypothetical protein